MNVLLLGSGGREHALAWKLAQSNGLDTLYAAPGNPGIAAHATCVALDATDHAAVVAFVQEHGVGLVVVGPEAPLVDGLADSLRAAGVPVFGPSKAAAQLEGSKGFTKDLCRRADIPTAGYVRVSTLEEAQAALATTFGLPVVIKADGLAAGKGVTVAFTKAEAEAAITDLFSVAGAEVVIEEFLEGEEASLFVLTDGEALLPFGSAQDHKRVGDGDTGPNTGGMGAYSPARVLTPELEQQAIDRIVRPTVDTLRAEGTHFSGVLYAGLMLTEQGPKLIEYNARFGDPECQVLMLRFQGDLLAVMLAVAEGRLAALPAPTFSDDPALTVVMAASGYPGTPKAGGTIDAIDAAEATGAVVFQAGTRQDGDHLVASGGRVLAVTASAATVGQAQAAAYRAVDAIRFPDGFCRRDIGWREVAREADATGTAN
ncbi:phosphoribosylamine--glycine ligase [Sphingomonas sp. S17]|uniref:Phosphoribosylamine--glycine ligase n=2 Tax=Sphingomonas paucimobilis TaxID=13689 RepID=A0A411LJV6_SPHPI|nr:MULTISPECIES: phosphoribosylamine--glycine ligase [Sphingomonas]EGI56539.1 phosphoribosylamine--glycine ligase [Sphingomonas sp. S17]MBQ1480361.1 phosphoribosylamine--glycine ligase [Sphingomonas sp.]MCM3678705.1 phosphoribosylamine--glycine ligase [Sphingomonas paucimobilis]MDG5969733.1 phosphoribosylamine--glycine ligase [Sphingomonas paucimobilis]NNG58636.1 phosphoribosylamine--glycine ligase [Sphingomonas paucimobilis]